MKRTVFRAATATLGLAALTACGGGSTGGNTGVASYQTWNSSAAVTSTLGGTVARGTTTGANAGVITLNSASGSVTHNSGSLTVNNGQIVHTDGNGFNASGTSTSGTSTIVSNASTGFTGSYQYVRPFQQSYTTPAGTNFSAAGFIGIVTAPSDVPSSSSATYTGDATGSVAAGGVVTTLSGQSSVNVNFGGTTTVVLSGLQATNQPTTPIDTMTVTGMTRSGNQLINGTLTTSRNGATVNLTGSNTTNDIQGVFFGYDTGNNRPDEVAGQIVSQGDNGVVIGAFIAD